MKLNLDQDEINEICHPLMKYSAQVRFLRAKGLHVERRADGSPLVSRAHYIDAMSGGLVAQHMTLPPPSSVGPKWSR